MTVPNPAPLVRHAAYLEALDERAERMRKIQELAERNPKMRAQRLAVAEDLVITAGRRSILVRHAPMAERPADDARCDRCSYYLATPWPCGDYRDAAAGLDT